MKFKISHLFSLFLMSFMPVAAQVPSSQEVHQKMHSHLLANAKSSIDKSVIQDYIKAEFDSRDTFDPVYGDLSKESVEMISDLLSEARSHSGKRYRYGAKGPSNFDCSGFTGYVYNQFGYNIGASSRNQFKNGIEVEEGDLRPGDLVFFTGRNSKGGVGHVGIVVNADNENKTFSFIHSAISNGIRIDNSTDPYYHKRYLGARRIITE